MEVNPDPFRGPVQYGLEVNTGDALRSETRINGIAVARCEVGEQGVDLLAIHHDVLPGENLAEVVLALPATVDGQTTAHYLADRLAGCGVSVTSLARGVPVGGDLDWLDDGTIAQAMRARRPA